MFGKLFRTQNEAAQGAERSLTDVHEAHPQRACLETSTKAPDRRSGRVIAWENEIELLKALCKFGWLTSRQIGEWVWPAASQQTQMARRTLTRLKALDQLLVRTLPNGVPAYLLSASGAARLREHGVDARSGKDVRIARWLHRAICNWHAITLRNGWGHEVYSEHELYTGRCPIGHCWGKMADTVQVQGPYLRWVEVEHSRRRPSDMRRLMHLLVHGPLNPTYTADLELVSIELVTTDVRLTNSIEARLDKEIALKRLTDQQRHQIQARTLVCVLTLTPGLIATEYTTWREPLLASA